MVRGLSEQVVLARASAMPAVAPVILDAKTRADVFATGSALVGNVTINPGLSVALSAPQAMRNDHWPTPAFGQPVTVPVVALGQNRPLAFRAVNRRGTAGYDPGFQRHHLLPCQLLSQRCFGPLFEAVGLRRVGFDDFRSNGLLLPASDSAAIRIGLPLHRGPHRDYNAMVIERVGQVEESWARLRLRAPEIAIDEAAQRLRLIQRALRRRLLDPVRKRFALNRHDPVGTGTGFAELDAMADALWPETDVIAALPEADIGLPTPAFGAPPADVAFDPSHYSITPMSRIA